MTREVIVALAVLGVIGQALAAFILVCARLYAVGVRTPIVWGCCGPCDLVCSGGRARSPEYRVERR